MHVAPDPARFVGLQRLQASFDGQSLVILGAFVRHLPALRRLGTLHVCGTAAVMAWLPSGLEECVVAVDAPACDDACVQGVLAQTPRLQAQRLHVCLAEEGCWSDAALWQSFCTARTALLQGSESQGLPLRVSIKDFPAESTPLCRPVP
mmetsp:Transcript_55698/g.180815  ORF Transcript_55698/g.180815 Transcript_55698/m.180815 type:complete len:149 (+) Transcript_55698:886-1332(+)